MVQAVRAEDWKKALRETHLKNQQKRDHDVRGLTKYSYIVPCSSRFRDQIMALARRRNVSPGDLAKAALLLVPMKMIENYTDPGEPLTHDRERVVLKSGVSKGRRLIRKPRLQVRMSAGYDIETLRKALALAYAIDRGDVPLLRTMPPKAHLSTAEVPPQKAQNENKKVIQKEVIVQKDPETDLLRQKYHKAQEKIEQLKASLSVLAFDPISGGVKTRQDALFVLGFGVNDRPSLSTVKSKFKMLAMIFHPDAPFGDHNRMTQLNAAKNVLEKHPLTSRH